MRALIAHPNICGYNAFHTSGGVLLRPSSTKPDRELPPTDVWRWTRLGERVTELSGYPVHSVYEDFTWDPSKVMSGVADDWAYEHLGVYSWTTEFWDVIARATGQRVHPRTSGSPDPPPSRSWPCCAGPTSTTGGNSSSTGTRSTIRSSARWSSAAGTGSSRGRTRRRPTLEAEVAPHARFAVHQALAAPCLEVVKTRAEPLGPETWRVEAGLTNTGWLPTTVTDRAAKRSSGAARGGRAACCRSERTWSTRRRGASSVSSLGGRRSIWTAAIRTTARPTASSSPGSSGRQPERRSRSWPAIRGRHGDRRRSPRLNQPAGIARPACLPACLPAPACPPARPAVSPTRSCPRFRGHDVRTADTNARPSASEAVGRLT